MSSLTFAAVSETGPVRDQNEDRWTAHPDAGLYVVSDGIGGVSQGELAAQIVVDQLAETLAKHRASDEGIEEPLAAAVAEVSDVVHTHNEGAARASTGATVVAALIDGTRCAVAHLGDSRVYLLRGGELSCLTTDHTIAQILVEAGEITDEGAAAHPARNKLTRYVGMAPPAKPDVHTVDLQSGDRLLLCSDGVSGVLDGDKLVDIVTAAETPDAGCRALVDAATKADSQDNMTALLVYVG